MFELVLIEPLHIVLVRRVLQEGEPASEVSLMDECARRRDHRR